MENSLAVYESILRSLGCSITDGMVTYVLNDEKVMVGEKRLVLPTQELLKANNWTHVQPFHPLCENLNRDQSPVLKVLRQVVNARLSHVFSIVMAELMGLAVDTKRHETLTPDQAQFLTLLPDVTEKTISNLEEVIKTIRGEGRTQLVNVFLKKGGNFRDRTYKRAAIVNFPLFEEDPDADPKANLIGVTKITSKKDKAAILALANYIMPNFASKNEYSAGSNDETAPYFHALMLGFINVMERLNAVVYKFRKIFVLYEELHSDLKWKEALNRLDILRIQIPILAGNEGEMDPEVAKLQVADAQLSPTAKPSDVPATPTSHLTRGVSSQGLGVVNAGLGLGLGGVNSQRNEPGKVSFNVAIAGNVNMSRPPNPTDSLLESWQKTQENQARRRGLATAGFSGTGSARIGQITNEVIVLGQYQAAQEQNRVGFGFAQHGVASAGFKGVNSPEAEVQVAVQQPKGAGSQFVQPQVGLSLNNSGLGI